MRKAPKWDGKRETGLLVECDNTTTDTFAFKDILAAEKRRHEYTWYLEENTYNYATSDMAFPELKKLPSNDK